MALGFSSSRNLQCHNCLNSYIREHINSLVPRPSSKEGGSGEETSILIVGLTESDFLVLKYVQDFLKI